MIFAIILVIAVIVAYFTLKSTPTNYDQDWYDKMNDL